MLEFIELKVSLHAIKIAKEVQIYLIYMALGFALVIQPNTKYTAQISQGPKFMEKFTIEILVRFLVCGRLRRHICLLHVWVHFIELH